MTSSKNTMDDPWHILGWTSLIVLTVLGGWALVATVSGGHTTVATTQHVPWGLWVAGYIFFLGLSAGAFLLSSAVYVFGIRRLETAGPLALLTALACLLLGGLLVVLDLGHPSRIVNVLRYWNPTSVMAWMGLCYNVYILVILAELYFALRVRFLQGAAAGSRLHRWLSLGSTSTDEASVARDHRWLKALGMAGIPIALGVHGGVGAIFAVAKARPAWFSGLFPIVFIVSALASGAALLALVTALALRIDGERKKPLVKLLFQIAVGILACDLLLFASEILVTLYGRVPHELASWKATLFGPFWWVFWFGQLGMGFVVPVLVLLWRRTRDSMTAHAIGAGSIVLGIFGARLNLVIPAQINETLEGLSQAFHHARNALGYEPRTVEWGLLVTVVAAGAWLFILARRYLPLEESR